MKAKLFTLVLLTAILSFAVVSATSLELNLVSAPTTADHNSDITITFNVSNNGVTNYTALDWSASSTNIGSWKTLPTLTALATGETETITAVLTIPEHSAGTINAKIDLQSETSAEAQLSIPSITINSDPQLSILTTTELTKTQNGTITVTNTGNTDLTNLNLEIVTGSNDFNVEFSESDFTLLAGASQDITVSPTTNLDELGLGDDNTITLKATDGTTESETITLTVPVSYCKAGNIGDLKIERVKFTNNGFGDKNDWYLTDEIEGEIRVKNTGEEDLDNVIVEWGLYDKNSGEFIIEDEESDFNLYKDEKETLNIVFSLDPNDFDAEYSENDFVFYVKAYYVKAYSDDTGESTDCVSEKKEDINVRKDKHFVILDNLQSSSDTIPCSSDLDITATAWNIGDSDEKDVYVQAYNKELGINERIEMGDLDVLDDKKITFSTIIPKNVTEKYYNLELRIFDENNDIFENEDNDKAIFLYNFKVEGNCQVKKEASVKITAELDPETPEAIAGKQVIVRATIENTGDAETTYLISTSGNSAWSNLAAIDPQSVTLKAGESKEVSIFLNLNNDAKGEKEFTIKAAYDGGVTEEQAVALSITEKSLSTDKITQNIKDNWLIYVIVLVNIILIIAIISVIKRMTTKPL